MEEAATAELLERQSELAALQRAVELARAGEGTAVAIVGPAGVGKTSLLRAVRDSARTAGIRVCTARASELQVELPFGIATQLLEPELAGADEPLAGAAELARPIFDPQALAAGPSPEPTYARLHGLYWLVANLCAAGPALLLVDDAHWCDPPSGRFLDFLIPRADGLGLAVVIAARPGEWFDADLEAALIDRASAEVLRPRPLSAAAARQVLTGELQQEVEDPFAAACHHLSGGNPFFLHELAREIRVEGIAPRGASAARLGELRPDAINAAVLLRLSRLSTDARRVGEALSVLDSSIAPALVEALCTEPPGGVESAIDELLAARILTGEGPWAFEHPIVRASIYHGLAPNRRGELHRLAAEALRARGATAGEIATHLLRTAPGQAPGAVESLGAAAAEALGNGAPAAASRYLRRALEERLPPNAEAALRLQLGGALLMLGDQRVTEELHRVLELSEEATLCVRAADLLLTAEAMHGEVGEALATMRATLDRHDGVDPELRLRAEAHSAVIGIGRFTHAADARALVARLRGALDGEASATERAALSVISYVECLGGGPADEVAGLAERALRGVPEPDGDLDRLAYPALCTLIFAGRTAAAQRLLAALLRQAEEAGAPFAVAIACCWRAFLAMREGRPADAQLDAERARELGEQHGLGLTGWMAAGSLAGALIERGELDRAEAVLAAVAAEIPEPGDWGFHDHIDEQRAALLLARNDAAGALELLLAVGERHEQWSLCPGELDWRPAAAIAAAAAGEALLPAKLAGEAVEASQRFGAPRPIALAARARSIGEPIETAIGSLEEASALLARCPDPLEQARTRMLLGARLRAEGRLREARSPLHDAAQLADSCGAALIADRARKELLAAGGRPRAPTARESDVLSAGELRIASLAAEGRSNREIAESLFLSVKTVEGHLTRAYDKLEIRSRSDLPAALEQLESSQRTAGADQRSR